MQTISVEQIENYPALKMTWQHEVKDADVIRAFGEINNALLNTDQPIFVVVDLSSDPNFPLLTTVHEALGHTAILYYKSGWSSATIGWHVLLKVRSPK